MKTSSKAKSSLKGVESFRATAYKDGSVNGVQMYSIGYGHQIQSDEKHYMAETITKVKADQIFDNDIAPIEAQINHSKLSFNQNEFDALVSFGYNTGSGALASALSAGAAGGKSAVTAKMAEYVKTHDNSTGKLVNSSALEKRRASEITLFNSPVLPVGLIALCLGALIYALR